MWHTQEKVKTYTGSFSLVLAYGLSEMIEQLEYCYEVDEDDYHFEHRAFANLTLEQKAWTVHKVAFGLLDRKTPIVPLTAFSEATVATIFRLIEELVTIEIDMVRTGEEQQDWFYDVRRAILAVHEEAGRNLPDFIDDDEPLKVDCEDVEEWEEAISYIECSILWDSDFDLSPIDKHPDLDAKWRNMFTIDDDYFAAIPDDPLPAAAQKLLQETDKLCSRVIKREAKKLCRTSLKTPDNSE